MGAFEGKVAVITGGEHGIGRAIADYKTSKGAIQFPYDRELPLELIREIAKWAYGRYAK